MDATGTPCQVFGMNRMRHTHDERLTVPYLLYAGFRRLTSRPA